MTGQRQVILEALQKVTVHPTADEVFELVRKTMSRISLATIYRNLDILSSLGLVQKVECAGNQRRYDGNPRRHHHIRCHDCGKVSDISAEVVAEFALLPDCIPGYRVMNYSVMFIGLCDECRLRGLDSVERLVSGKEEECGDSGY